MKKMSRRSALLLAALILGIGSCAAYMATGRDTNDVTPVSSNVTTKDEALIEAENFQPPKGLLCTAVLTPAVHEDSGASYTFASGCLPSGWKKLNSGEAVQVGDEPAEEGASIVHPAPPEKPVPATPAHPLPAPSPDLEPYSNAQEEAIAKARNFQPPKGMMCTTVMTPAQHTETGAYYTFPYGCLPAGWVAVRSGV